MRVLIVDDHPLFRRGLVQLLQVIPGFQLVGEAAGGAEGLALAPALRPDLLLLDLNLPKVNGREVLQAIRAHHATRSLPVVVLTTSAEPFDVDAVYELGANSYIQKPVEFERFVEAVRQIGLYWLSLNQVPGNP